MRVANVGTSQAAHQARYFMRVDNVGTSQERLIKPGIHSYLIGQFKRTRSLVSTVSEQMFSWRLHVFAVIVNPNAKETTHSVQSYTWTDWVVSFAFGFIFSFCLWLYLVLWLYFYM